MEEDYPKTVALLEEAIALDTTFAVAYSLLSMVLGNRRAGSFQRAFEMLEKAYEHRDRLTDRERYFILAKYYEGVDDREKAMTA